MHALALVDALKRMLKGRAVTYAMVAVGLDLSEASVKRMFSRRDFTLQRLEDICSVAGIDFGELAREAASDDAGMTHLTVEQEREIVSDPTLMLIALCAVGNWTFEQIVETYDIPEAECLRCLARLDRHRIIGLRPGNRIRSLIDRTFAWLPGGPIQRYFRASVESEFLASKFEETGMMTGAVTNMMTGTGRFQLDYKGETLSGEATRVSGDEKRGVANAYGPRGTYMSCDYKMNTPYQGAGSCTMSNGAKYEVHLGG